MLYFAYGSNMKTGRLENRVGKVKVMGKGQPDVIALLPNKDLLQMADMTGAQLVELLEKLSE